jgi:uncharacterized damage-inducible protein DinB
MSKSLMADPIEHHVWATLGLIDACDALSNEQLASTAVGTYGTIIDTLRHIVGADSSYLYSLTGGTSLLVGDDELETMGLAGLRATMQGLRHSWTDFVNQQLDGAAICVRRRQDGSELRVEVGLRLAQVLHHGTEHRSQICTVLTTLGLEPPEIDVWTYAERQGRLVVIPATS